MHHTPCFCEQAFPEASFDYVLLDAPCSALGLRPRLQQTATMMQLTMAATYQRKMLQTAVALLKPGGILVYSTCTINPGAALSSSYQSGCFLCFNGAAMPMPEAEAAWKLLSQHRQNI